MPTTPTQIRIDTELKQEAVDLFDQLGLDLSTAVNIFLHQCILHDGLPFQVNRTPLSRATLAAIAEAEKLSKDPTAPSYDSMEALKKALEEE